MLDNNIKFNSEFEEIIAQILIAKNYLTYDELKKYIKICNEKKKRLGTVLLENNIISRRDLYTIILSQLKNKDLPKVLVDEKFISFEELTQIFLIRKGNLRKLGKFLIKENAISEENFAKALAKTFNLTYVAPNKIKPVVDLPLNIDKSFFTTYLVVITKFDIINNEVEIAICDPSIIPEILNYDLFFNFKIKFVVSSFSAIINAIEQTLPKGSHKIQIEEFNEEDIKVNEQILDINKQTSTTKSTFPKEILDIITNNNDSHIRPLFEILYDAVRQGASEIHFEVFSDYIRILAKINGYFFNVNYNLKISSYEYIVAKIKYMSDLIYDEERIFQTSSFKVSILGLKLYVHVLIVPTICGENIILKILPLNNFPKPIENYFKYQKNYLLKIKKLISENKKGLIILSSYDEFLLSQFYYSLLNDVTKIYNDKKIISIEKSFLCEINDVNQILFKNDEDIEKIYKISLDIGANIIFINILHNYDLLKTASFLMSNLSNDAILVITMNEINISSIINQINKLENSDEIYKNLLFILAGKIVNYICGFCREENYEESLKRNMKVYHGYGCSKCYMTGISKQSFIFEFLEYDKTKLNFEEFKNNLNNYEKFETIILQLQQQGIIT